MAAVTMAKLDEARRGGGGLGAAPSGDGLPRCGPRAAGSARCASNNSRAGLIAPYYGPDGFVVVAGFVMGYLLGVDVGTTFTAAAVWRRRDRRAEAVLGDHANTIPSVLYLRADGAWLVGESPPTGARSASPTAARSSKRRRRRARHCRRPPVRTPHPGRGAAGLGGGPGQPAGGRPSSGYRTCPANWGEYRRGLLIEAARQAGLGELTLLSEPVAAATWYASLERLQPGALVGVYDLGGGTFDAAVLRATQAATGQAEEGRRRRGADGQPGAGGGFELCGASPPGRSSSAGSTYQAIVEHRRRGR